MPELDSASIKKNQSFANPARKGMFAGQKLKVFIAVSVAAHAFFGLSWGVPAYIEHQRAEQALRVAEQERATQLAAEQAALEQSRQTATKQTLDDVRAETRDAFDDLVASLSQTNRDALWDKIEETIQPVQEQLASALGDTTTTEQDLLNMQAELNRTLVGAVNAELNGNASQDETEQFLARVRQAVAPELVKFYAGQMTQVLGTPLRKTAEDFTRTTKSDAKDAVGAAFAGGQLSEKQLVTARDSLANATREFDAGKPEAATTQLDAVVESLKSIDSAAVKVQETSAAWINADPVMTSLKEVGAAVTTLLATLTEARQAVGAADRVLAGKTFTVASLQMQSLINRAAAVRESVARQPDRAEWIARATVGSATSDVLPKDLQDAFAKAFDDKASTRIAGILSEVFNKRLKARGIEDEKLVARVTADAMDTLKITVPTDVSLPTSGLSGLKGFANSTEGEVAKPLVPKFQAVTAPIIVTGAEAVAMNTAFDKRIAELALTTPTPQQEEMRDRVADLASNIDSGRSTSGSFDAIGSSRFTDLRTSALTRNDLSGAQAPSTLPTGDPLVGEVKNDITASLETELAGVLNESLTAEQTKDVLDSVVKAADADLTRLAQDVLDAGVSDSDLEIRRTEFSKNVLSATRTGLDALAVRGLEAEILRQLESDAGKKLAEDYRKSVKENAGGALVAAISGGASAEKSEAEARLKALKWSLDTARDTVNKAVETLDRSRATSDRAAAQSAKLEAAKNAAPKKDATTEPAAPDPAPQIIEAEREKLAVISGALDSVRKELAKASDVPIQTEALKQHLAGTDKAFEELARAMKEVDDVAQTGDAKATTEAITKARQAAEPLRNAVKAVGESTGQETVQAQARFIKAASEAAGATEGDNSIPAKVTEELNEKFRAEAAPEIADRIVQNLNSKLMSAGVDKTADDTLKQRVIETLEKVVTTGPETVGQTVGNELSKNNVLKEASKADGDATKAQREALNKLTDAATEKAVATVMGGERAGSELSNALGKVEGPVKQVSQVKDDIGRMESALRGGRGGLMGGHASSGTEGAAAEGAGTGAPGGATGASSLAAVRGKWRELLASGPGGNGAQGASGVMGGGTRSDGKANAWLHYYDEATYQKLMERMSGRTMQAGQAWARLGATGDASKVTQDTGPVPASVVVPEAAASAADPAKPYEPTFKSISFATVPYLNQSIDIGGPFSQWDSIPVMSMKPEKSDGTQLAGLKIVDVVPMKMAWDNNGLYFMVDMTDTDDNIKKSTSGSFWAGDTLEVFLDTMNTKERQRARGAGQQFWVWPFGGASDETAPGGESFKESTGGFRFQPLTTRQMLVRSERTPAGYRMHCRINTENIRDADLVAGKILGLNLTVETGTSVHYYWSTSKAVGTFGRPDTWGDVLLGGSDGTLDVNPQDDAAIKSPRVVIGQPLRIRVTDSDMNLNDRVQDKLVVHVNNPRTTDNEVAVLQETGVKTGVFEGAVRTALDIGEKVPGTVSCFEGEKLRLVYLDQARGNGARNIKVTRDVRTSSPVILTVGQP